MCMPIVDCHCHLEAKQFEKDRAEVIERNKKKVNFIVNSGVDFAGNTATLELHHEHPSFIHAALGLSPSLAANMDEKDVNIILNLIREHQSDIVAIGEVGLDYHWVKTPAGREKQKKVFQQFIDLADELDKPLVVHSRDSITDVLDMLERKRPEKVMIHHFSGDKEAARRCVDMDIHMSLCTGFRDKKLIKLLPLEYILTETDSPYNCPTSGERNEPFFVRYVVALISTIKEFDVTDHVFENALRFFSLSPREE